MLTLNLSTKKVNDYILEVGNLGDTEAAEIEDFNVLEAPPGGHVRKPSIPP